MTCSVAETSVSSSEPLSRHSSASLTFSKSLPNCTFFFICTKVMALTNFSTVERTFVISPVLLILLQRTRHSYSIMFHFRADAVLWAYGHVTSTHVCRIDYRETNTTHIIAKVHHTSFEKREQLQIVVTEP